MITYSMVVQVVNGDALAAQQILDHFDAYINSLCKHPFIYENGRIEHGVDTYMKAHLQGRLLEAVVKFKP